MTSDGGSTEDPLVEPVETNGDALEVPVEPVETKDGGSTKDLLVEPVETDDDAREVPVAPLRPALEALLMVADQPLDEATLAAAAGHPVDAVRQALAELVAEYDAQQRGFELRTVAGGWRYYTREELAPVVEAFVLEGQQARLTQAALETLAVVAYQQPVSRSRVSAVRGVNVDGVMRTLLTRGLVEEAGHDTESGAHLYRTTTYFLERIGVTGLDDLPELAPFLPELDELDQEVVSTGSTTGSGGSTTGSGGSTAGSGGSSAGGSGSSAGGGGSSAGDPTSGDGDPISSADGAEEA